MTLIDEYVEKLQRSVDFIKTIDGFLVKLSSLAYDIEDKCSSGLCNSSELFREVIESDRLVDVLSKFSCYIGEIESLIENDPRHKILRKYLDIITSRLSSLKCIEDKRYDIVVPTPTWLKERYGETSVVIEEPESSKTMRYSIKSITSIESFWKVLFIISIVLIIISLIVVFIKR